MSRSAVWLSFLALGLGVVSSAGAQSPAEARAARAYDVAVKGGPLTLHAFLDQFP